MYEFKEEYVTGIASVDAEHKRLFEIADEAYQLTKEELEVIVKEAIVETGASSIKDMGKIMSSVMPKTKGRADGKMINEIAKAMLS